MFRLITIIIFSVTVYSTNNFAQSVDGVIDDTAINEINKKYEAEYRKIQEEADQLGDFDPNTVEAITNIAIETKKKRVDISFHTPSVSMKLREMKFHTAKIYMVRKEIKFDLPRFEWGRTNIGPIKLDLPKIYSKRHTIKLDLPKFKWEITSIKTKIPKFFMQEQVIKFDIPKFRIYKVKDEAKDLEEKAAALQERSRILEINHKSELKQATTLSFLKIENDIKLRRESIVSKFDAGLKEFDAAIEQIKYYGINPEAVRNEDGSTFSIIKQREELLKEKEAALKELDEALSELLKQKELTLAELS